MKKILKNWKFERYFGTLFDGAEINGIKLYARIL